MLISIMIFTSLTGNKTGPTDIRSKEYTPSGPTSNYLDRSKVQWSKCIGPRNTLTLFFGVAKISNIFLGVFVQNGRCWVRAYARRKN